MKKLATFASAVVLAAAAGQASAAAYDVSASLNLLGVNVSTTSPGAWDDATGDGNWVLHIDGTSAGFGVSDLTQTWTMDALSGTGVLNAGSCSGDAVTCAVMGGGIVGPMTASIIPVGAGSNGFTFFVSALGQNATFDVTLAPVPVPAAAWLFGSALLGLTGVSRRRRAA